MDDVTHWDSVHKKIHTDYIRHSHYAEEKEKLFPRGSNVCELGGGTGNDAMYFLSKGHSVVLLDISEFALTKARESASRLGFSSKLVTKQIHFGLHKIPLKDNSIDVAYSRIALHYFESKHTAVIFDDIYRFLKPGGQAFLTFKSPEDREELLMLKTRSVEFEPGVYIDNGNLKSRFTKEQLEAILAQANIKDSEVTPIKEPLFTNDAEQHYLLQNEVKFKKSL